MKKKQLRRLNAIIIILFLVEGLLAGSVAFFMVAIANGALEKTISNFWLTIIVGFEVILFAALIAVIAALFSQRASVLRTVSWMKEIFSGEANIMDSNEFERYLAKALRTPKDQTSIYVAAISLFAFRGQPMSNYGQTFVYAFNEIAVDALKNEIEPRDSFIYAVGNNNVYYVAGRTQSKEEFSAAIQATLTRINESASLQPSLPPLYALAGYLEAPHHGDVLDIMKKAGYAMNYKPAQRLSGDIKIFNDKMITAKERYQALDSEIDRALEKKEFIVFYQAKWNLKKNAFYGAEALIRWRHPQRGYLPPSIFIPAAESSGKINEIDHYVFETVCADMAKWAKEKQRSLVVSINLSRRTVFDPNIISFMAETIKKYNVNPANIEIELTESIAAQFTDQIRHVISKIQALGFSTSMDDFGIGYSSLSSIKNIPFNVVKLDKSFIDDIEQSQKSKTFVASIIALIHSMHIFVIAEGVETTNQVEILRSHGLDAIQGYYYSRPLERTKFEALLANNQFEKKEEVSK